MPHCLPSSHVNVHVAPSVQVTAQASVCSLQRNVPLQPEQTRSHTSAPHATLHVVFGAHDAEHTSCELEQL
jgi:hypothetical protein